MRTPQILARPWTALALLGAVSCSNEIGPEGTLPNGGAPVAEPATPAGGATAGESSVAGSGEVPEGSAVGGASGAELPQNQGTALPADNAVVVEQAAADAAAAAENPELFAAAQQYFPAETPGAAATRLFRLTLGQLDNTTALLLPDHADVSAVRSVPADPLQHNYEYAEFLGFNDANFTPVVEWATQIATNVGANPETVIDCLAADEACLRDEALDFVGRAFRHVPSDEQLGAFVDFFVESVAEVGLPEAVADLARVTLTSPHYVFREEVLADAGGILRAPERLQNLTYTLADAPPEALGLNSASASDYFASEQTIEDTLAEVLASPEAREKLLRFFTAWLEIDEADSFNISTDRYPEFTPEVAAAVVDETRSFLRQTLTAAAPSLKSVTQSTDSFVSDSTAFLYGLAEPTAGEVQALDPAERFGIFTHPAFIASHSGPETTRLIKRGVFFTRKVMCLELDLPPDDVDTTIANDPDASERERVENGTNSPTCLACHQYINPFGFLLESYDPIGRFRTEDERGAAIEPGVTVDFLEEGAFSADTAVAALSTFTQSLRFQQCFARQLFRFYVGRSEGPHDDPLLRQLFFNFANGDAQDIVRMLRTLSGSSSFSQRLEITP